MADFDVTYKDVLVGTSVINMMYEIKVYNQVHRWTAKHRCKKRHQ